MSVIITCEHASRAVPSALRSRFRGHPELLRSHRGWDPGAKELAEELAALAQAPLHLGQWSRLVVDLNRSPHNPRVFSELTRDLDRPALLDTYHRPYWEAVHTEVDRAPAPVAHLGIHSFTSSWEGEDRGIDLAMLYDPRRPGEKRLALECLDAVHAVWPEARLRRNAPYRGTADGIVTALRRRHGPRRYLGLELEIGQDWVARRDWPRRRSALARALESALRRFR